MIFLRFNFEVWLWFVVNLDDVGEIVVFIGCIRGNEGVVGVIVFVFKD